MRGGSIKSRAAIALLGAALATGAAAPSALAGGARAADSPVLLRARSPLSGLAVLLTTHTVRPKVQRTVRFTGYATYTFAAPKGRRIVSASAKIVGAQAHAVAIRSRTVSRNRRSYTVRLVFPGEQGNPGKLVVRLGTVA
jgi:hypothetical protein